ncbi:hypothetical protein KM92DES2_20075 [uncultured Desulfovibrio sp.]|uniref:Uncharacterized protein n=1 Tax=uncultured Desulfovibrio sp. TaxID=167968 RepID=A0A212KIC8_9BACT|nr:hypothetical protein KM92DES2_20075 [uncultured Desulfovibrio sp.]
MPRCNPLPECVRFAAMREPLADRLLQIHMQEYTVTEGADLTCRQRQHERKSSADWGFAASPGNLFRISPGPLTGADGVKSAQRDLPSM